VKTKGTKNKTMHVLAKKKSGEIKLIAIVSWAPQL